MAVLVLPNVDNFFEKINYLLKDGTIGGGDQIYTIDEWIVKEIIE